MKHDAVAVALLLNAIVVIEGILAYKVTMFSPKQMNDSGNSQGMPWITHFGASWGDFFIVSPLVAVMYGQYGNQWVFGQHLWLVVCVITATVASHYMWSKNRLPDCLAWGNKLTPAGWVHMLYMCIVLTGIVFFFFQTSQVNEKFLVWSAILIGFHIAIGNHLIPCLIKPRWWPHNTFFTAQTLTVVLGIWTALFFRCWYILKHQ